MSWQYPKFLSPWKAVVAGFPSFASVAAAAAAAAGFPSFASAAVGGVSLAVVAGAVPSSREIGNFA